MLELCNIMRIPRRILTTLQIWEKVPTKLGKSENRREMRECWSVDGSEQLLRLASRYLNKSSAYFQSTMPVYPISMPIHLE
jgi:hypothetical protein